MEDLGSRHGTEEEDQIRLLSRAGSDNGEEVATRRRQG
jgi:hypothetical protein